MIGKILGNCEIIEKLGQGGMGEVWRARDRRLDRDVALKLLSPEFANDPERIARFQREARTLASLNHPNVASLYGFEESDGHSYLLMELVEGEELATRIDRGRIDPTTATAIARQIALGLEAAHAKGVVHRDLKPSNVRITPDGEVKILDFGLARAFTGDEEEAQDPATSPTITAAMTHQGVILGTAAYMSPEQARGLRVDHRADIWAFGVILWEMLHGERLFDGDTMSDTLANVLKHPIDLDDLPGSTPPALRTVLRRCLERDPRQRLHSIADARIELDDDDRGASPAPIAVARGAGRLPWLLVAALTVATGFFALRPSDALSPQAGVSASFLMPEGQKVILGDWPAIAVAPDGAGLAVTAAVDGRATILYRARDSREFRSLTRESDAISPFFSPDGRWVGFFQHGKIRKVAVDGGSPVDVVPMAYPRGMAWSDDGYIYYSPGYASGIKRVSERGDGEVESVTTLDSTRAERTHRWPLALPHGRGIVFTCQGSDSPGDYEDADILMWDARTGQTRQLGIQGASARYSATGHLLVARRGTIYSYEFDLEAGAVHGGPTPVFDGVSGDRASGMYSFALSGTGDLYFLQAHEGDPRRTLAWIDRDGESEPLDLPPAPYRYPALDPGNGRVALVMGEGHGGTDDIYMLDLASLDLTRFTFDQMSIMPKWDPSGTQVLFLSVIDDGHIRQRHADGSRPPETLIEYSGLIIPGSLHPNGHTMFFTQLGGRRLGGIRVAELDSSSPGSTPVDSPAAEWAPAISPDGNWLAYVSDETGREEIYVQPWPLTGAKWQISRDGGRAPKWSPSGDELNFVLHDRMYAARIDTRSGFRASSPELLFTHPMDSTGIPMPNYDVARDGRFLVVEPDKSRVSGAVHVELGWAERLAQPRAR